MMHASKRDGYYLYYSCMHTELLSVSLKLHMFACPHVYLCGFRTLLKLLAFDQP